MNDRDQNTPFLLIDPTCVVSGTCDLYLPLTPTDVMSRMSELNDMTSSLTGDPALYTQIGTLPLYVALEGKNRVMLYREHFQKIGARIRAIPYPRYETLAADDLAVHELSPFGQISVSRPLLPTQGESTFPDYDWLSGGRAYAVLPFPDMVVPLLLRYGVGLGPNVFRLDAGKHQRRWIALATEALMEF